MPVVFWQKEPIKALKLELEASEDPKPGAFIGWQGCWGNQPDKVKTKKPENIINAGAKLNVRLSVNCLECACTIV